jgi:integrase
MRKQPERYITDLGPERAKRYRVAVPRPDGSRPTTHWRTLDLARIEKARVLDAIAASIDPDKGTMLFRDVCAEYVAAKVEGVRTMRSVGGTLTNHVLPRWGTVPIGNITTPAITAWIEQLGRTPSRKRPGQPLMPKSVHTIYACFKGVLKYAVAHGYREHSPCVARIDGLPTVRKQRFDVDPAIVVRIARELDPAMRAAAFLAATTGMRRGEVRGLWVSDIDAAAGVIRVRRQMVSTGVREPEYDDCKRGSKGDPEVPPFVLTMLAEQVGRTGARGDALVFPGRHGNGLYRDALLDSWKAARERAGVTEGYGTFHALRHHAITLLLANGMPPSDVAAQARHSDVRTTMGYSQRTSRRGEAARIMEQMH